MLAQANFSHKELHGKSNSDMHKMLHDIGIKLGKLPRSSQKRYWILGPNPESYACTLYNVKPNYKEISELVDKVMPKED